MDNAAREHVLTIVQLLAKGIKHDSLSPVQADVFNRCVEALIQFDADDFVRDLLRRIGSADSVLVVRIAEELKKRY
jgi:hypothetical protein